MSFIKLHAQTVFELPYWIYGFMDETLLIISLYSPKLIFTSLISIFCSRIPPWGTLLMVFLNPDFMPLITTLWTQGFTQFWIHVTVSLSGVHVVSLYMMTGQCWKIYKSQYSNHSLVSPPTQLANHLIVEGSQACKAYFSQKNHVISFVGCFLQQGRMGNQRKVTLAEHMGGNLPSWALFCFEAWILLMF